MCVCVCVCVYLETKVSKLLSAGFSQCTAFDKDNNSS